MERFETKRWYRCAAGTEKRSHFITVWTGLAETASQAVQWDTLIKLADGVSHNCVFLLLQAHYS